MTRDRHLLFLIRSSVFVDQMFTQVDRGKPVNASSSALPASISGAIFGKFFASWILGRGDGVRDGLSKDRAEHRSDHVLMRLGGEGEQVPGEMHPATLM